MVMLVTTSVSTLMTPSTDRQRDRQTVPCHTDDNDTTSVYTLTTPSTETERQAGRQSRHTDNSDNICVCSDDIDRQRGTQAGRQSLARVMLVRKSVSTVTTADRQRGRQADRQSLAILIIVTSVSAVTTPSIERDRQTVSCHTDDNETKSVYSLTTLSTDRDTV